MENSQRAIVLNLTPWREADLLLTLLSEDLGKLRAIARGARSSKKRFMGGIDYFDCGRIELSPGKDGTTLYQLNSFTSRQIWSGIMKSSEALVLSSLGLELVDKLCAEGDPQGGILFRPLFLSLRALDRSTHSAERFSIVTFLLLHSMRLAGYDLLDQLPHSPWGDWCRATLKRQEPIIHPDGKVIQLAVKELLEKTEQILEKKLKTAPQVLAALEKPSAKNFS